MAEHPRVKNGVVLRGRVIEKVLAQGTPLQRRFLALERVSGGQFLALHNDEGHTRELKDLIGKWVEVEGDIWFQSLTARSIVELSDPPG